MEEKVVHIVLSQQPHTFPDYIRNLPKHPLVSSKHIGNWMFYRPEREFLEALGLKTVSAARFLPENGN